MSEDESVRGDHLAGAYTPAQIGGLTLANRFIKAATFEGKTPGGRPGAAYAEFHNRIAKGGVAMTTLAYCAAEADGRISGDMMYMHEGLRGELEPLIAGLQANGTKVCGQLVHCGGFSRNSNLMARKRPLGPSRGLNLAGITEGIPFVGAMTPGDMDDFALAWAKAATFMQSVGFDAIELHFGHGYSLCQFISPRTNRRSDEYGGTLANRMRLPLRVLEAVRGAVGEGFPLLAKISLSEGVRGGLEEDEAIDVARMLDEAGIDAIVTSGGSSSGDVMKMFRGQSFLEGLIEQERRLLSRLGMRLAGKRLFKTYPYEELYFVEGARRVRAAVKCAVVYVGGCSSGASVEAIMSEGFDFIELGRTLIHDPGFVKALQSNPDHVSGCSHCNKCVPLIDHPDGVRCMEHE